MCFLWRMLPLIVLVGAIYFPTFWYILQKPPHARLSCAKQLRLASASSVHHVALRKRNEFTDPLVQFN